MRMFRDWGYDGLKLDGQHMNAVPPCYNPAHKHARPEESVEAMPAFFKMIFDTARAIKPDALVEFCPCGTAFNYYTLADINMSVASDPRGSWQVRTKGKTLKALHGDALAYFGDHVELSDGHADFASTVGIGGVVGTQFTWPPGSAARTRLDLLPDKEAVWQKWVNFTIRRCFPAESIWADSTISDSTGRRRTRYANPAGCSTRFTPRNGKGRSNCAACSPANTDHRL